MRGRCMLILIWLVRKYKKTRERIQTVQMNLFGLFIFKSDVRAQQLFHSRLKVCFFELP